MAEARIVHNPSFGAELDAQLMLALGRKAAEIRDAAKRNTSHPSIARTIRAEPPRRDASGPYAAVKYGRGLGPIFEGGTGARFTRNNAHRGRIQAESALRRAVEQEVPKGLDL